MKKTRRQNSKRAKSNVVYGNFKLGQHTAEYQIMLHLKNLEETHGVYCLCSAIRAYNKIISARFLKIGG